MSFYSDQTYGNRSSLVVECCDCGAELEPGDGHGYTQGGLRCDGCDEARALQMTVAPPTAIDMRTCVAPHDTRLTALAALSLALKGPVTP